MNSAFSETTGGGGHPAPDRINTKAWDVIRDLQKAGATNLLRRMIGVYLEQGPTLLAHMKDYVAAGDAASLYRAAHNFKSNSRYLGAYPLGDLCEELESISRAEGVLSQTPAMVEQIEREYVEVAVILQAELAKEHP